MTFVNNIKLKVNFIFAFNNFPGIHFTMSFSKDEAERNKFRSWSKFWTELTKIGYKVK